jgi:hypothetical protein
MFANSRECGTAFLLTLAIQFSKTEFRHSRREDDLESSPNHAESRRQPCWFRKGRRIYFGRSVPSRGKSEKTRASSRPEEPDFYLGPLHPVKLSGASRAVQHRGHFVQPLVGSPFKRQPSRPASCEGRAM